MEYRYEFAEERDQRRLGWKKLVACILGVVLCLVGIFLGGYFKGIEEGRRTKNGEVVNTANEISPKVNWPVKSCISNNVCPEGFLEHPLILISLDGFRSDYLARNLTPAIQWLANCGVQGPMQPVFPSKTFPNHYSIITGLYPESHGIVDNKMYDPVLKKVFTIGNKESLKPIWWQAEPLWVTAEKEHKKAALYFWPGSDVKIKGIRPSYYRTYNGKVPWNCRVETVFSWLDLPAESRPSFITVYLNEPDSTGHNSGPYSSQLNDTLEKVDSFIESLLLGLEERNLLGCVNIVIVADHGMDEISCDRVVAFDNYMNVSDVEFLLYGVTARIRPTGVKDAIKKIIGELKCKSDSFQVYDKRLLPKRYHYSSHYRIDPIVIDLLPRWLIFKTSHNESQKDFCNGGAHGYDNIEPSMRALFVAHGPSLKRNITARPFPNIELYNLLAELLDVIAQPNNGTKGSLHYLMKTPGHLKKRAATLPPPLCHVDDIDFGMLKQLTGCPCVKENLLDNYEDTMHIPWGAVLDNSDFDNTSLCLLYNDDYTSAFHYQLKLPMWTAYTLKEKIWFRKRTACWNVDSRVSQNFTPSCKDYSNLPSNMIQEPLFPPEFASSTRTVPTTWLVTNSVPMFRNYSLNLHKYLQDLFLKWTSKYQSINVVSGPAFDIKGNGIKQSTIDILESQEYGVPLPTHYFFVITRCLATSSVELCPPKNLDAMAFIFPHLTEFENCLENKAYLLKHSAKVKDVEALTGLRFFPLLPPYEGIRLRAEMSSQLWER